MRARLGLPALLGAVTLLSLPGLVHPPGRDQGIFATAGLMLAEGRVLYRDVFEVKQPLTHFTYAAALVLGGGRPAAVQGLDAVLRLLTVFLVYALARRRWGARPAWLAGGLAGLYGLGLYGDFWDAAQAEAAAGAAVALAAWLLPTPGAPPLSAGGAIRWALAGAAAAAAVLYKATALIPAAALLATAPGARRGWPAAALGASLAALPLAVYFVAHHAVAELLDVQLRFNRYHAWRYPWRDFLALQAAVLFLPWVLRPLGLLQTLPFGAALAVLRRGEAWTRRLSLWYLAAYATVFLQGKGWLYHYQLLLVPQVLLMVAAVRAVRPGLGRLAVLALLLLPAGANAVAYGRRLSADLGRLTGRLAPERYLALPRFQVEAEQRYRPAALAEAAAWLRGRARPGDRLLVFGLDQTLNFLAGLLPPNRYLYSYPLVAEIPQYRAERQRHRRRFLAALRRSPPRFLVVPPGPVDLVTGRTPLEHLLGFRALARFVAERYEPVRTIGGYLVLERR